MPIVRCEDVHCRYNLEYKSAWTSNKTHYCSKEEIYITDDGCHSYEKRDKT